MKILIAILLFSSFAFSQIKDPKDDLKLYKNIEFYKYFFHIYNLKVYSSDSKRPDFKKPHKFHFIYKRDIEAQDLVDTTISEWDRLHLCRLEHAKKWGSQLQAIWPNIKKGDHLIALFDGDRTIFYQNNTELGRIEGKIFSRTFFKIWLNKDSLIKELRN